MTPPGLTAEELAELKTELAKSPGWQTDELLDKLYRHRAALISMSLELLRLRGALEFLDSSGSSIVTPGKLRFATQPASVLFVACDLGFIDPTAKGG